MLPKQMERLIYETHMHTPLCKHAVGYPSDYARQAHTRNLKGIIVTCHCPLPDRISAGVRMDPDQWPEYLDLIAEARDKWKDIVDIRTGVESDFLPGLEPWLEELHGQQPLDYVLGSVHPQIKEYRDLYFNEDWPEFHRQYFSSLAEAAETSLFDCLSHPDLVKNVGSAYWDLDLYLDHIRRCLDRIANTGIAMELNTSGLNKAIPEMNPGMTLLREIKRRDIPVVIGADAHHPDRVGDRFIEALDLLEEAGFTHVRNYLSRNPVDLTLSSVQASLTASTSPE